MTVKIFYTTCGALELLTFEQFLIMKCYHSKAYQSIEPYNMQLDYCYSNNENVEDALYTRETEIIQELSIKNLEEQFLNQLEKGRTKVIKGKNIDDLVEEGARKCVENFGTPDTLIKFSDKKYVIIDSRADCIKLKYLSNSQAAIINYKPKQNVQIILE